MYLLVTDYNYENELYQFSENSEFLTWFSNNVGSFESIQNIDKNKDILYIDHKNLEYAHVRYYDAVEPNKHYCEIVAYDPSNQTFEGSIAEYIVLHSHVIESFQRLGKIKTA